MTSGAAYAFGPFQLDARSNHLTRAGERVTISDRHLRVLAHLLAHAGSIASKDDLITAAWGDVAVTDNSLEQVISSLRRVLGDDSEGRPYVETVPRRGYRFASEVVRVARRETDETLDGLLAPHRAWIEGRAALETLEGDQIVHAREVFERVLRDAPDQASAHVGLANACVMQFEMTRADERPDVSALALASSHALEACRLEPEYGEAWGTLGFVLDRSGRRIDALAASKRAVSLEPDNWRHHFRLAFVGWGEERLRAARRTLALLPDFPLAHWLAATVHVARQTHGEAIRELTSGIAAQDNQATGGSRFSGVALHWLLGLIYLSEDDETRALSEFERELSFERSGHLYARECCANTWYAIGALRLRQSRPSDAREAFEHALERVAKHPMARVGMAAIGLKSVATNGASEGDEPSSVDIAICKAAQHVLAGSHADAVRVVDEALAAAAPGNAGWVLPVEPLLRASASPERWAPALARLRTRAA